MQAEPNPEQLGADRILEAAERIFADKGFAAASIQGIADAAGVSKANVFHHFGSKDELFRATLGFACERANERVLTLLGGSGEFAGRLKRMMRADIEFMLENPQRSLLVLREIMNTRPEDPGQPAPEVLHRNCINLVETLRAAQQAGEIRDDADPAAVALLFIAANVFYFQTRNLLRHFPEVDFAGDHERFVDKISDLVLHGVLRK